MILFHVLVYFFNHFRYLNLEGLFLDGKLYHTSITYHWWTNMLRVDM